MHITRAYARNMGQCRVIEVISAGMDFINLYGKNESAKSSFLDMIEWAFRGPKGMGESPLRHGEEEGEATVELSDPVFGDLKITRLFTPTHPRGKIVVGGKQGDLDELFDTFSFRPLEIATQRPGETPKAFRARVADSLVDLAGPEFKRDLHSVDDEIITAEEARKNAKADLSRCGALTAVPDIKAQDGAELQDQLKAAREFNEEQRQRDHRQMVRSESIQDWEEMVERFKGELAKAEKGLADAKADVLPDPEPQKDEQAIVDQMMKVSESVAAANAYATYQEELARRGKLAQTANEAEGTLTALRDGRARLIANAKLPIPGITWDDSGVFLDGVSWEKVSRGRRWLEATRMAKAKIEKAGKKLRVLILGNANEIDDENRALIKKECEGYQIWSESILKQDVNAFEFTEGRVTNSPEPF